MCKVDAHIGVVAVMMMRALKGGVAETVQGEADGMMIIGRRMTDIVGIRGDDITAVNDISDDLPDLDHVQDQPLGHVKDQDPEAITDREADHAAGHGILPHIDIVAADSRQEMHHTLVVVPVHVSNTMTGGSQKEMWPSRGFILKMMWKVLNRSVVAGWLN